MTVAVTAADVSRWDVTSRAFVVRPGTYTLALRDESEGGAAGPPLANFTVL